MLDINCIEPELIKVCLTEDGFTSCCYVSSMHLAEEKRKQLEASIAKQAALAFSLDPVRP